MKNRAQLQQLMPLMREFGGLERQRLGEGVTPLEFQRWLDLKGKIGQNFSESRAAGLSAMGGQEGRARPSILLIGYRTRDALLDAIVPNILPAGFFVPTPFAAEAGTRFVLRVTLESTGEVAEFPATVVTSITQGAHTLSTMSMGMSVKILRPSRPQAAGISKLFDGQLDSKLGLAP